MNNDNHESLGDFLGSLAMGFFLIGIYLGFAFVVFWFAFLGHNCNKTYRCNCRDTLMDKWGEVSLLSFATGAFICLAAFVIELFWGNGIFNPIPFYIGGTIAGTTLITLAVVMLYAFIRGLYYLFYSPILIYREVIKTHSAKMVK